MKNMKKKMKEFFFPPHCLICDEILPLEEREGKVCASCANQIPFLLGEQCGCCGRTITHEPYCRRCKAEDFPFTKGTAAFSYETMRKQISLFKFHGYRYDGAELGVLMAQYLEKQYPEWILWADYMTAVPLHPKKEKHRGFNQADLLCKKIAEQTGMIYEPHILRRTVHTKPQSKLDAAERRENLKNVFDLYDKKQVEGRKILLVDDIFTTGTTLKECTRVLMRAGAAEVRVFCLSVVEATEEKDLYSV